MSQRPPPCNGHATCNAVKTEIVMSETSSNGMTAVFMTSWFLAACWHRIETMMINDSQIGYEV